MDEDVRGIVDEGDTKESYKMWKRMRPYIAMTGTIANPLHIKSVRATNYRSSLNMDYGTFDSPIKPEEGVSALAAFEYILKHGLGVIANPNPIAEWGDNEYGFSNSCYNKLRDNIDFLKFQKEFLEKTVLEG